MAQSQNKIEECFTAFCEEDGTFYNLKMYISDFFELVITCIKISQDGKNNEYIFKDTYQNFLSNKFYLPYESIEEIKQYISSLISNNTKIKENNKITKRNDSLLLEIPAPLGKANSLFFELKLNLNYIVNNLINQLSILNSDYINLKKEMNKMKKDFENKINLLELENKNKTLEIKNLKEKIFHEQQINDLSDSDIILLDERKSIIKMINPSSDLNTYNFKLIFKASKDGDSPNAFHSLCDNKGPTIIFIKINNGKRIGGYTSISWNSKDEFEEDENAFLFSLDKKEKYELNKKLIKFSVGHFEKYGPTWGSGYGLYISNFYKTDENCSQENNCYKNKNKDFIGIDKSKVYFSILDYEVYTCEKKE